MGAEEVSLPIIFGDCKGVLCDLIAEIKRFPFMDGVRPVRSVRGFCTKAQNGSAVICINSLFCEKVQRLAIRHELAHLMLGHLEDDCTLSLDECEREADEMAKVIDMRLRRYRAIIKRAGI